MGSRACGGCSLRRCQPLIWGAAVAVCWAQSSEVLMADHRLYSAPGHVCPSMCVRRLLCCALSQSLWHREGKVRSERLGCTRGVRERH